jgi:hypothetical protein
MYSQQKCQKCLLINVWRKIIFDIYFTEFGAAFDNSFTCFVQVLLYILL